MALTNQPRHCAPPERGTIGNVWDYKHLAPLERRQFLEVALGTGIHH
jgi:hypothetical protein